MSAVIPFNKPAIVGDELEYVRQAVENGNLGGDGAFTRRSAAILERQFESTVLLTPSCTAALELASLVLGWGPGQEVILPSFTFVSTASAVVRVGARPVFVDIDPRTLQLDLSAVERALSPRTRAILPVHYGGASCAMDDLLAIAQRHNVLVVEDAAHAIGSSYRGRPLGTFGSLAAFSFHETKNVQCGQGGALVINDRALVDRAEILRDKGTNRAAYFRGQVDRYSWVDVGSAFQMSELAAAYLAAQLEHFDVVHRQRRQRFERYLDKLRPLADRGCIQLPAPFSAGESNGHIAYLLAPDQTTRDRLLRHLNDQGVSAVFHYVPLHASPVGRSLGYQPADLPITQDVADRLLRLPLYHELTDADQDRVIAGVESFFDRSAAGNGQRSLPSKIRPS
jgi:dTDP-4-amino-4,6-dideoxygalactose transaminase